MKLSLHCLVFISFLFMSTSIVSQNLKQEKMKNLSFMIGDWVGTSNVYADGKITKQVPAFQKISYDVNAHIVVIELHSELLQLHTIIYYDEKDEHYYYYPFSKRGVSKSPATFKEGKLIVQPNKETRYVFSKTSENGFRERGEKMIDGKWVTYFEDNFKNTD